ncbi:MAG TPA: hypothetical protein VJN94_07220 [Candidatus Binataceae bacterium]|nr:hypothetical protein [Candidatus Binataceae bacterium]
MRALLVAIVSGLALAVSAAPGYSFNLSQMLGGGSEDQSLDTFKIIRVADLKTLAADPHAQVHIYDVNGASTRDKFGVIPGASLLDSDDAYPLSALPANKGAKLVFYCANTH